MLRIYDPTMTQLDSIPYHDYTDDFMQIDLTARYTVNDNLTLTAEAINLNDEPEYYYFGNTGRLSQYYEYCTTYGFGLRWTF